MAISRAAHYRLGVPMSQAPFSIRPATPADGPVVRDIVFDILRSYGITPDPEGLDADVMTFGQPDNGALEELVAAVDGRAVGLVSLGTKGGAGWLSKLFVDPSFRGRGIGKALLLEAVSRAGAHGLQRVGLTTRTIFREAVALYESTGWTRGADPPEGYGPDRTYFIELPARPSGARDRAPR
jgi:putative acetyltransferase